MNEDTIRDKTLFSMLDEDDDERIALRERRAEDALDDYMERHIFGEDD